jgi:outer membrane lipoprotein-sorting protein
VVRRFLLGLSCCLVLASAASAKPLELTEAQKGLIDQASGYLSTLGQVYGRFSQVDAYGSQTSGRYAIRRPGRARFQYDAPSGLLVVADGHNVSIYDQRLKTFDQYPEWATPLGLFLAKTVRLDKSVEVTKVTETDAVFGVTLRDRGHHAEGAIELRFRKAPLTLVGWAITDGQGQVTQVRLDSMETSADLDTAQFKLRDPRPRRTESN